MGHFLPGGFFVMFATWWTFSCLHRFYRARYRKGSAFHSTLTFPCVCCCNFLSRYQLEGFFKLLFCSVGLAGEIITGWRNGEFVLVGNKQHATMFAFFGISGVIDILMHHGAPLPKSTDYVFNLLCFAVEGLLFMFHLHGRSMLDKAIHHILVYVIWCCVLSTLIEIRFRRNIIVSLSRCFFVMLQGTWFIQVGSILYPPFKGKKWNGDSHEDIMIATIIFAWHMFFIFLFMSIVAIVMARIHSRGAPMDSLETPNDGFILLNGKRRDDQIGLMESDDCDEDPELGISSHKQENTNFSSPN